MDSLLQISKIAALPSNALNLNTAWNLYNIIASSERYGPIVDIDDVYSPEHLVFCFDTFQKHYSSDNAGTALAYNRTRA